MSKRSCPLLTLALLIGMAITSLALALPVDGWDAAQLLETKGTVLQCTLMPRGRQCGRSIIDNGPDETPGAQQATVQGRVQQVLHGPDGDVNGAILDDGTTLKFPPPVVWQASSTLQPGQVVTVQGWALSNTYGRGVDAQTIGAGSTQVMQAPPAPPPDDGTPPPPSTGGRVPPPPAGMAPPPPPAPRP